MSVKNFCWMVLLFSITNVFGQGKINENNRKYQILKRGDESISIPFKMKNNKPVFDLMVNNIKATLMIDNGLLWDPVWLFGTSLVNELQLTSVQADSTINLSENDPTFSEAATNLTVQFEDIVFFEQPVIISPPEAGFVRMFPGVDGQLSNTLFKHFIVEFDFINQKVILHNPKDYKYKGNGNVLDMTLTETGTHAVPFSLVMPDGKVYNDKVDIDFGGIHQLKIALNETNQIELPDNVEEAKGIRFKGVSPEYKGKLLDFIFH